MSKLIEVDRLTKKYGKHYALRDISFSLEKGDIFGLIGPNGAGKTTTIEIIEGIRKPTSGIVTVFGENPIMNRSIKSRINASIQGTNFFYELTMVDILKMYSVLYDSRKQLTPIIQKFSLGDKLKEKFKNLSGGQKQKLSLAIAFINDPELLFLDEPTAGLDPISRNQIWEMLKEYHQKGKTIFITSHYMEEIERLCNRVIFIDKGKIVEQGQLDDILLRYSYSEIYELELSKSISVDILQPFFKNTEIKLKNNKFILFSQNEEEIIGILSQVSKKLNIKVVSYKMQKSKLEDIYIKLIGE